MAQPKLKPLARAHQVLGLRTRVIAPTLTRQFEEQLFASAEVLSEGSCRTLQGSGESYFGSCMITIDLEQLQPWFRGGLDRSARLQLASALDGSVRVRLRAMRLARAEAMRRTPSRVLGTVYVETRIRLTDRQLHIDVDLEAALSVSSGSRTS